MKPPNSVNVWNDLLRLVSMTYNSVSVLLLFSRQYEYQRHVLSWLRSELFLRILL